MKIQKNIIVLFVLVALVVGGGCFYWGMVYGKGLGKGLMGKNFNPEQLGANFEGMGQRGNRAMGTGATGLGMLIGEVVSQDNQSLTLSIKDSGTKIVFFSSSTQVMETKQVSLSDITVGSSLMVNGKQNTDGSLTAQSIQIRPVGFGAVK